MPSVIETPPRPPEPDEDEVAGRPFEVVYDHVQLDRPGVLYRLWDASVAWLPKRRCLVARWELNLAGPGRFGYRQWRESPDLPAEVYVTPDDLTIRVRAEMERQRLKFGLHRLMPSAFEAEVERFQMQYPLISEKLGLIRHQPARLFEMGTIDHPLRTEAHFAGLEWEDYRDRHSSGDFGLLGWLDPQGLLDPETLWSIGLQPINVQNTFVIQTSSGVVRSRYALPEPMQEACLSAKPDAVPPVVCALTIVGKDAQTLLYLAHPNQTL
jgi:hypothetical protein